MLIKPQLDLSLYLVTQRSNLPLDRFLYIIEEAVKGGVTIVQLREKDLSTQEMTELAMKVQTLLKNLKIPLIINDNIEVAYAVGAAGVHLGQSDKSVREAREVLGPNAIIGLSVETFKQAISAQKEDVDYLGASPVFSTTTKLDCATPLQLKGLKDICNLSKPVVGIGGINESNIKQVIEAGAAGAAVVSAIFNAQNPQQAAQKLFTLIRT